MLKAKFAPNIDCQKAKQPDIPLIMGFPTVFFWMSVTFGEIVLNEHQLIALGTTSWCFRNKMILQVFLEIQAMQLLLRCSIWLWTNAQTHWRNFWLILLTTDASAVALFFNPWDTFRLLTKYPTWRPLDEFWSLFWSDVHFKTPFDNWLELLCVYEIMTFHETTLAWRLALSTTEAWSFVQDSKFHEWMLVLWESNVSLPRTTHILIESEARSKY